MEIANPSNRRVLVTGSEIESGWLEQFEQAGLSVDFVQDTLDLDSLMSRLSGANYYLYGGIEPADDLTSTQFEALYRAGLRTIAFAGKGVTDFLNVPAATAAGIEVTNTPGAVEPSVAEFTTMLMICVLRNAVPRTMDWMSKALPSASSLQSASGPFPLGQDLSDMVVGIVGLGDIGYLVAKCLRDGYGCKVVYTSRHSKPEAEQALGITYLSEHELTEEADIVSFHLANTPATRELVAGMPLEGRVGRPVVLVNTASEALINADRLANLLESGAVAAAGFDKIYKADTLVSAGLIDYIPNRLLVTNHSANATRGAWRRMTMMAVDQIVLSAQGVEPPHLVRG